LDLIATLGRRHRPEPLERLTDRGALRRWLDGAGLPTPASISDADVDVARGLREALHGLVRAHRGVERLDPADLEVVNRAAARPDLVPTLDPGGRRRREAGAATMAMIASTLARDAIDLIATTSADRVRECEHPDCSLLFFDHTQGNRRRWCSMQRCGNQLKVADYRERRRVR
jgi:predicted RNA-binding Zn ribbon-like protein